MSFDRRPFLLELHASQGVATERLISEVSVILDWSTENLVAFSAYKAEFFHSPKHNSPYNCPIHPLSDIQLSPPEKEALPPGHVVLGFCSLREVWPARV